MALRPVEIEIKDPLTLSVHNTQDVSVIRDEGNRIVSLEIPDKAVVTLGKKVTVGNPKQVYRINSITSRPGIGHSIYDLRIAHRTKASVYVLPMLPGPKHAYFFHQFFMNSFIATPEEDNVIAVLYRYSGIKSFVEFEAALKKLTIFQRMEDLGPTTLYVFKVPEKWEEDYKHFIAGRYSKMSNEYKKRILEFHNVDKKNVYGQILYKDEKIAQERRRHIEEMVGEQLLPHEELQSSPELEHETYDPKIYDLT